jgi:hypothetical protein
MTDEEAFQLKQAFADLQQAFLKLMVPCFGRSSPDPVDGQ